MVWLRCLSLIAAAAAAPSPVTRDTPPTSAYAAAAPGLVNDAVTGLQWQQAVASVPLAWSDAAAYCAALRLGEYADWRLPTAPELTSIVSLGAYNPAINVTAFPGTPTSWFWSSTRHAVTPTYYWAVNFEQGWVSTRRYSDTAYVRCVRGGKL
jgi:hypothetical protein